MRSKDICIKHSNSSGIRTQSTPDFRGIDDFLPKVGFLKEMHLWNKNRK